MGIISVEQVDHLYWLGRYTERVYTTLALITSLENVTVLNSGVFIKAIRETLEQKL